jgi:two-component system chemotaxis sensor kinase CheA
MKLASDITQQDIKMFLQEADELLQLLDEDIVRLETEKTNTNLLQEIFRAAHTLKGSSATLGHHRMAQLAHAMENVLDGLRKGTLAVNPQLIDAILNSLDTLRALKGELISPKDSRLDTAAAIAQLEQIINKSASHKEVKTGGTGRTSLVLDEASRARLGAALATGHSVCRIRVNINQESSWAAVRCFQVLNELSSVGEVICSAPSQKDIEQENVNFTLELVLASTWDENTIKSAINSIPDIDSMKVSPYRLEETITAAGKPSVDEPFIARKEDYRPSQTIRVDVSRLDSLMEQIGEMVINCNQISQLSKALEEKYRYNEPIHDLGKTSTQVMKIVNILQQDIMRMRMLPIDVVFSAFPRMVRDLSRKVNKKIDFIIEGQDTEVDRSVIEYIRDPLVHLLRNAIDHGIETPEKRKAAGKKETGIIRLSAYHEENHIVLTIEDDGRGLDPDAIKGSAVKKGLISAEKSTRLTDDEAIDLIFISGISTARKATEISGRGVGMDVVRTNIERLNGSITIDTKPEKGTKFKLMLPLTLAMMPSLMTSIDHTFCAIPLANIVETAKLQLGDIQTVTGREVIILRGKVLPLLRLAEAFDWQTEAVNHTATSIVVVKSGETQVGLIVDSLIDQQEIVIKPLGNYIGGAKGVAGASILGDGQVALVLDIASLVQTVISENQQNRRKGVHLAA